MFGWLCLARWRLTQASNWKVGVDSMALKKRHAVLLVSLAVLITFGGGCNQSVVPAEYRLSIDLDGEGEVTPSEGVYADGSTVEITARSLPGWRFVEWAGDVQSSEETISVAVGGDVEIRAVFVRVFEVTTSIDGSGIVDALPEGEFHDEGTTVTLQAHPLDGWRFVGWEGGIESAESSVTISVDHDYQISAVFVQVFAVESTIVGQGEVLIEPESPLYDDGQSIEIFALPEEGWEFDHWEGDLSGSEPAAMLAINGNKVLTAVFVEIGPDLMLIDALVVGKGIIAVDPIGEPALPSGLLYESGTTVTLEAVPDVGWYFVGWGGDVESVNSVIDVTLTTDAFVFALFEEFQPPPPPIAVGAILVANDGTFLGNVNDNSFDPDSLANPFGTYGNEFGSDSIWNRFGTYGSEFSSLSVYNAFTSTPPILIIDQQAVGYVTKNEFLFGAIDPDELAAAIGRYDAVRN